MKHERGSIKTGSDRLNMFYNSMKWPAPGDEHWRRTDISTVNFTEYLPFGVLPSITGEDDMLNCLTLSSRRGVPELEENSRQVLINSGLAGRDKVEVFHFTRVNSGFSLSVPEGKVLDSPLILRLNSGPEGTHQAVFGHITAGEGSSFEIVLIVEGKTENTLCTGSLHMELEAGSSVKATVIQDLSRSSRSFFFHTAEAAENSRLEFSEIDLGSALSVSAPVFKTMGYNAEISITGLYAAAPGQHKNLRPVQDHVLPGGKSTSLYKGALIPGGQTVFQGLIRVEPGAAKTDAYLSNKNLLTADGARADSIPSLQILNNDVRCTHGSTTGKLNPEELFYLQSRGFSKQEAEQTLLWSFFEGALGRLSPAVAENARTRLESHPLFAGGT